MILPGDRKEHKGSRIWLPTNSTTKTMQFAKGERYRIQIT